MSRPRLLTAAALLAALVSTAPPRVAAQGFGVYEQGTCTMGRAGAAVAAPCADGSAIFFNPAGIATHRGTRVSAGVTLIAPSGRFRQIATGFESELEDRVYPVPHAYVTHALGERYAVGVGLFAPYGLETNWPSDALGRFVGYRSVIEGIYLQPTAAARITDWLALGAGFDLSLVHVRLSRRLDLAPQPAALGLTFGALGIPAGTDFADLDLEARSTGTGFHVGALVRATPWLSLGARFLSRQRVDFDDGDAEIEPVPTGLVVPVDIPNPANPAQIVVPAGTPVDALVAPQFAPGAPLSDQGGATRLRLPEQLVVGAAARVTDQLTLLVDYQYTNWDVFDELPIRLERLGTIVLDEDFRTTHGLRIGAEYGLSDATSLRAGWYTHGAAAPRHTVTPNLPEAARTSFTAGLGTRLGDRVRLDLAYQYIDQADRAGRSIDPGPEPTAPVNDGLYEFRAHLVGATVVADF